MEAVFIAFHWKISVKSFWWEVVANDNLTYSIQTFHLLDELDYPLFIKGNPKSGHGQTNGDTQRSSNLAFVNTAALNCS